MTDNQLTKGAKRPLLFILPFKKICRPKRFAILGLFIGLLTGCSNTPPKPVLFATGYLSDDGSVRIWRKDLGDEPIAMISDYVPYDDSQSQVITRYEYLDGSLSRINRHVMSNPDITETLRFDENAKLTFNQRVLPDRKEMIGPSTIEFLSYHARQTLEMSRVLQAGKVRLIQGRYQNGVVTTCSGQPVYLELSPLQRSWLSERLNGQSFMGLAWLTSATGEELLLITKNDVCASQPTLDSL